MYDVSDKRLVVSRTSFSALMRRMMCLAHCVSIAIIADHRYLIALYMNSHYQSDCPNFEEEYIFFQANISVLSSVLLVCHLFMPLPTGAFLCPSTLVFLTVGVLPKELCQWTDILKGFPHSNSLSHSQTMRN